MAGKTGAAVNPVERITAGPGVTQTRMLSRYHPPLKGTPGDTAVYVLDSGKPGGSALIAGGAHGNEPSGYVTAILLVENARVTTGRLFVIPHANASALAHPDPRAGAPREFTIQTPGGGRTFRYGSRLSNPAHQAPDPARHKHPRAEKDVEGDAARNLNRLYPGKPDGNLTEQIAYGIVRLIRREKVDIAVDLHEANPDSPIRDVLIAHERALEVGAETVMRLQAEGVKLLLDVSPPRMWGLSHREWGDNTDTLAILMETVNPAQGPKSGEADESTIVSGINGEHPLAERVARHLTAVRTLLRVYSDHYPKRPVAVEGLPDYAAVRNNPGAYLAP